MFYRNFYYIRKEKGLIVERPDSIFIQSSVDDKDIRRLILFNPMGRSFLRKYFRFIKSNDTFIINPKLKIALDGNDLKEINIISNQLLDYYYNKIIDNPI